MSNLSNFIFISVAILGVLFLIMDPSNPTGYIIISVSVLAKFISIFSNKKEKVNAKELEIENKLRANLGLLANTSSSDKLEDFGYVKIVKKQPKKKSVAGQNRQQKKSVPKKKIIKKSSKKRQKLSQSKEKKNSSRNTSKKTASAKRPTRKR